MKQTLTFNFQTGLSTKVDPWQIPAGEFLSLENMYFTIGGRLTKRFGYEQLPTLPEPATFLTTFNQNLTAIGSSLQALSSSTGKWYNKGTLQPAELSVLPLIRSNTNQSQVDTAISMGLVCTVYTDQTPTSLSTPRIMYAIADAITGQNIIEPSPIPVTTGVVTGSPRVFVLGQYFIIVFTNVIAAANDLQYVAVSIANPTLVSPNVTIAASYSPSPGLSWDGVVTNRTLYIAYDTASGGQSIQIKSLSATLVLSGATTYSNAGRVTATIMSVTADNSNTSNPIIWVSYYNSGSSTGYAFAVNTTLQKVLVVPAQIITSGTVSNIATVAANGVLIVYYEVDNAYAYDTSIPTHYISTVTCTQTGSVGSTTILVRSVGLASKAFFIDENEYFLAAYQSTFQPTYFLINGLGEVVSRIAYGNGGGYDNLGLPSVTVAGNVAQIGYLIKDFITSQNTSQDQSITKSNIYSQTGINLVSFTIGTSNVVPAEIAQTLNLSGGFLWEYDGYVPVEQNFFLWPDSVEGTPVNSGGAMLSQEYQYQVVYTWTNNQGNVEFSAPSIPNIVDMSTNNKSFVQPTPITTTAALTSGSNDITVTSATGLIVGQIITDTTTGANIQAGSYITKIVGLVVTLSLPATATAAADTISTSSINSVTLNIPTLRLTYKIANPVKIEIFRWSTAQEEFFQITSILQPLINNISVDYVTYTDTKADNQILGNSLIYTTGGVVENVGAPSFNALTLFDDRLWGIDAEDTNSLWDSKQVIEATPVEMSDLFTTYVAPSISAQGSTGTMKCLAPMDDKIIILKPNALYFINGTGPDNTGANSQYSQPIFISSMAGSTNQQSIVFTDAGLMFQSDKGIWLLARNMEVSYIGAPVESFTINALVTSAVEVPKTTQVRFTLNSGITLMYDYFYKQWATFVGVSAISSTLYQDYHTFVNSIGQVFQEKPNTYLDGTRPVLMQFTTGWLNLAGIQGYQRIYEFSLLGQYYSPHLIEVQIAYDFEPPSQQATIVPTNYSGPYGSDYVYGESSPYGGQSTLEQWRIQTDRQKCQVFQISCQEVFDPNFGTIAGPGFTLSGINAVIGIKKAYKPFKAANTAG